MSCPNFPKSRCSSCSEDCEMEETFFGKDHGVVVYKSSERPEEKHDNLGIWDLNSATDATIQQLTEDLKIEKIFKNKENLIKFIDVNNSIEKRINGGKK